MSKAEKHNWIFTARFRSGGYSWKASRLASQRLRDVLTPVIVNAPADEDTRNQWLERLWQAMADDGVDYLSMVGDRWGEICGSVEIAGKWADDLVPTLRSCWSDPNPGNYFHGATACLSCLLVAGRHRELLELLQLDRHPMWHFRRYGLSAIVANSYIARFRAVAKRYPAKDKLQILTDLIATTPGEEGKWFATAKNIEHFDLALELANRSHCDPKTLTRAARDYLGSEPEFALGAAMAALRWLGEGWGYEVTSVDVVEAYDRAMDAASRLNKSDDVGDRILRLVESSDSAAMRFVRQSLFVRMSAHSSSVKAV